MRRKIKGSDVEGRGLSFSIPSSAHTTSSHQSIGITRLNGLKSIPLLHCHIPGKGLISLPSPTRRGAAVALRTCFPRVLAEVRPQVNEREGRHLPRLKHRVQVQYSRNVLERRRSR